MKTRISKLSKILICSFSLVFIGPTSEAQFLKKLKKKVENAVENTVINKAGEKASQETSKSMDKVFNMKVGGGAADMSKLPSSYDFEWKYTLEMSSQGKSFKMNYFLKPDAKYFGALPEMDASIPTEGMFMVMDEELGITTIFMDKDGEKSAFSMNSMVDEITEVIDDGNMTNGEIEKIGSKNILGYECEGFRMNVEDGTMTMYVAVNTPVSFNQVYGTQNSPAPKGFDPEWLKQAENGLVMEMNFEHKKKSKRNMTMKCVMLEQENRTINVSDYSKMGQ